MRRAPLFAAAGAAGLAAVVLSHPGKPAVGKPTATRTAASPQPSGPASGPTANATGTATGKPENYGYGTLAVSVTAANGRIVQVSVPQLHTIDSYSQYIAQQVVPILRRQVLSVQNANIQGVSGASYTSAAFAYSLQSALAKLGMK
ncbi:MAG TPA: FMN-binding protein [Acidimicrobiales bacterium]|nr:FMN-binding protein [Acidimicrobiales bacterium]